ncbi:MAG TPA: DUF6512 family protein, partial [Bacillota bacterium]|nr:DUF6512 family protein [Bacillota bacterium]
DQAKRWIISGMLILCILGSLMHFVYQWSGKLTLVGIFAPTNESVWEHLKLTFWPMLIWWLAGYLLYKKMNEISAAQWFVSGAVAQMICPVVIVSFFYTYTGALGIESIILDIFSLFLGVAAGQGLALHFYQKAKINHYGLYVALLVLILLATAFTVFTFSPLHIPIFKDSSTGRYGV